MSYSLFMNLKGKQTQNLIMSPHMQQAIQILQVPIMELSLAIEQEMEQNPLLEYSDDEVSDDIDTLQLEESIEEEPQDIEEVPDQEIDFDHNDLEVLKRLNEDFRDHFGESESYCAQRTAEEEKQKLYKDSSIESTETLFGHLMQQARDTFSGEDELAAAEIIIGSFDESGFLGTPLSELAILAGLRLNVLETVLAEIQTFNPIGVGATSLKESLLIQLRENNKEQTLAYRIIESNYDDLIHNRIRSIVKDLKCTPEDIEREVRENIARLDLHPGTLYIAKNNQEITPDVSIHEDIDNNLVVIVNNDHIPSVRFNPQYLKMMEDPATPQETKDFIKQKISSAKWLFRNISKRNSTLERVSNSIAQRQKDFFTKHDGTLVPMTMKMIAEELELHESTIARTVANKYIDTDRGIFSMKYFFSNAYHSDEGEDVSSKTARDMLKKIIDGENKGSPLSDQDLSNILKERGLHCARRTVAKYRTEMQIGNAQQRRKY